MPRLSNSPAEQVRRHSREQGGKDTCPAPLLIPTGSTLLDLALTDGVNGGWCTGKVANLIGDSSSGKTILAFTMFAEAVRDPRFKDYRLIYDDTEAANLFDMTRMFGKATADRIEAPRYLKGGEAASSETVQEFQMHVMTALAKGTPFIYVLDSLDALTSSEEQKLAKEANKATEAGKEIKGSYGMNKAKKLSEILRLIVRDISKTKSFILIISQTRDNIDPMSFEKRVRAGGKALKFYCTYEVWLALVGKIKNDQWKKTIGNNVRAKATKNKLTGKVREIEFSVYYDIGVDDIGSCIDWLREENFWTGSNAKLDTQGFCDSMSRDKIIKWVENNNKEEELREFVRLAWEESEAALKLDRKRRYV